MPAGARILIADDEANTLEGLRWALEGAGVAIQTAGDGEAAWRLVQSDPPDLLLTDLRMPKLIGHERHP